MPPQCRCGHERDDHSFEFIPRRVWLMCKIESCRCKRYREGVMGSELAPELRAVVEPALKQWEDRQGGFSAGDATTDVVQALVEAGIGLPDDLDTVNFNLTYEAVEHLISVAARAAAQHGVPLGAEWQEALRRVRARFIRSDEPVPVSLRDAVVADLCANTDLGSLTGKIWRAASEAIVGQLLKLGYKIER